MGVYIPHSGQQAVSLGSVVGKMHMLDAFAESRYKVIRVKPLAYRLLGVKDKAHAVS